MRLLKTLTLIALLLTLAGCGTYSERKREMALESTLSQYRTAMRWGQWQALFGMRGEKAPQVPELDLDNIRVTGYEIRQPPVPMDDERVLQVVELEYVLKDSQRLRKLFDKQEWRYHAESKQWQVYSTFPEFR